MNVNKQAAMAIGPIAINVHLDGVSSSTRDIIKPWKNSIQSINTNCQIYRLVLVHPTTKQLLMLHLTRNKSTEYLNISLDNKSDELHWIMVDFGVQTHKRSVVFSCSTVADIVKTWVADIDYSSLIEFILASWLVFWNKKFFTPIPIKHAHDDKPLSTYKPKPRRWEKPKYATPVLPPVPAEEKHVTNKEEKQNYQRSISDKQRFINEFSVSFICESSGNVRELYIIHITNTLELLRLIHCFKMLNEVFGSNAEVLNFKTGFKTHIAVGANTYELTQNKGDILVRGRSLIREDYDIICDMINVLYQITHTNLSDIVNEAISLNSQKEIYMPLKVRMIGQ